MNGQQGGGTAGTSNATNNLSTPEAVKAAAAQFLEACRTGDDSTATLMLSSVTREKLAELGGTAQPPASDTARFELGEVKFQDANTALVVCKWTDLDETGQPQTDHAQWALRREPAGWRIAGVAYQVFEDLAPVLLDFEKPEELRQKQQQLRDLIARRMQQQSQRQAIAPNPQNTDLR